MHVVVAGHSVPPDRPRRIPCPLAWATSGLSSTELACMESTVSDFTQSDKQQAHAQRWSHLTGNHLHDATSPFPRTLGACCNIHSPQVPDPLVARKFEGVQSRCSQLENDTDVSFETFISQQNFVEDISQIKSRLQVISTFMSAAPGEKF